jgi:hypothetical protein
MFHVKQQAIRNGRLTSIEEMNIKSLFADTKLPKNCVEDVFDINPAEQPTQKIGRPAQLLRDQFLTLPDRQEAPLQRARRLLQ